MEPVKHRSTGQKATRPGTPKQNKSQHTTSEIKPLRPRDTDLVQSSTDLKSSVMTAAHTPTRPLTTASADRRPRSYVMRSLAVLVAGGALGGHALFVGPPSALSLRPPRSARAAPSTGCTSPDRCALWSRRSTMSAMADDDAVLSTLHAKVSAVPRHGATTQRVTRP